MPGRLVLIWIALFGCVRSPGAEVGTVAKIADRVERVTFASQAFGTIKEYCVVLPSNYSAQKADWPVLYLLHGRGRNDRSLIDVDATRVALLKASYVTVLPNGEDGWYLDSPVNAKSRYARLLEETIAAAEARYHLSARPHQRAIAGWSMGGYGAVQFAVTHPMQFAMVAPILGLLDFPRSGLPPGQSYVVPERIFGTNAVDWKQVNPTHAAIQLRGSNVVLITADRAFDRTMNEIFRDRLRTLQIEHEWIVLEGQHHFDVVQRALPLVIERVERSFAGPGVNAAPK